jgi:DNA-binding MarR family transcriptional regulator
MAPPATSPRPIGFWLRRADEAITDYSDQALAAIGLTRLHWQVLHTVHDAGGTTSEDHLGEVLWNFAEPEALRDVLDGFELEGWLARDTEPPGDLTLTEKGRAGHAAAAEIQSAVRQRLAQGITPDEYATVLRVLERIVQNLESGGPA